MDPAALIDELSRQGMGELLEHLMQTDPPDDPVVAKQVQIAQLRLQYQYLSSQADQALTSNPSSAVKLREQSVMVFEQMLDASRALIRDFPNHDARPIWQTDLAQTLLLDYLEGIHQSAALFDEFGITTPKQREALAEAGPEALGLLMEADRRLFTLQSEIGRDLDSTRKSELESSGLYFRLFDEYAKRRTPYFLSRAAYLVARLPNDSAYYKSLGDTARGRFPNQKATANQERERLLELAYQQAEAFVGELSDLAGVRASSQSLHGRVLLSQGKPEAALASFDELIDTGEGGLAGLTAQMARVQALLKMGRTSQVHEGLSSLAGDPLVENDLRYQLLLADLKHRVLQTFAKKESGAARDRAMAESYDPYLALLSRVQSDPRAQGLKGFIYQRWADMAEDSEAAKALPAVVRLAIVEVMRQEGQRLAQQADDGDNANNQNEAQEKLNDAIRLASTLTDAQTDPVLRSQAMYNQAMAMYWRSPGDPTNRLALAGVLTDLAEQMPEQPVSEDAIASAVGFLRELHQVLPVPVEVQQAYERAAGVLFKHFPFSTAADSERLYYGYTVLASSGKYREAVDMYGRVPFDHDDYFRAQRQALLSLEQVHREASAVNRPRVRRELRALMKRVKQEAAPIQDTLVNPDRARSARRAAATATLVEARFAFDLLDYEAVIKTLEGFEQRNREESDLVTEALQLRIESMSHAQRYEMLGETAKRMVADYPDEAAAVIDTVLTRAEQRIDTLRADAQTAGPVTKAKLEEEAQGQAKVAALLAELLLDWAKAQSYEGEDLLPFELARAKMLRLSGALKEAGEILTRLIGQYPRDAQVMLEYAEVLFARGDADSLEQAVSYYDQLITGLSQPYPRAWWVAWMRRLQINDKFGEQTEEIPLRVRQLRLTDPDLGGPVTKQELERLEHVHSR